MENRNQIGSPQKSCYGTIITIIVNQLSIFRNMKKSICFLLLMSSAMGLCAQSQNGSVKTISRPQHQSQQLSGVAIRVRGNHNAVLSDTEGSFSILFPTLKEGDAFVVSNVIKSGYELRDPDLLGRPMAFSTKVPFEVVMVNQQDLLLEKQRIEQKARESLESYYEKQLAAIQAQVSDNSQYAQQIEALEAKYEQLEQQISKMADRYARTDYSQLDSLASAINMAIESGDIDVAERLIMSKGNPDQREDRIKEMEKELLAQRADLANDLYHLFGIALMRFQPDSALSLLRRRAELDTTNIVFQLDLVKYMHEGCYPEDEALPYLNRAHRALTADDLNGSFVYLRYLNESAFHENAVQHYDIAEQQYTEAIRLAETLFGRKSKEVAGRLASLGAVRHRLGRDKEAVKTLEQAVAIYQQPEQRDDETLAITENNLGTIYFFLGKEKDAMSHLQTACQLMQDKRPTQVYVICMRNIGAICNRAGRIEEAHLWFRRSAEASEKVYGATHPLTQQLRSLAE